MNPFPVSLIYNAIEEFIVRHAVKLKRAAPEEISKFLSSLEAIDEYGLNALTNIKVDELFYDPSSPIHLGAAFCFELDKHVRQKLFLLKLEHPDTPCPLEYLNEAADNALADWTVVSGYQTAAPSSRGLLETIYASTGNYEVEIGTAVPILVLYLSGHIPRIIKEINDSLNSQ